MPDMRHAAGPGVIFEKIQLRRLHRALLHLRSLFLPPRIVKQPALRFPVFLYSRILGKDGARAKLWILLGG